MLFTKQIDQITYEDVVRFCEEKNREGFNLDYKRELPSNNEILAKWIVAFANTYGGLLIIGINASDGIPEEPFEGFDFDNTVSYDEKILSVILSNIHQPVFPEVKVCDPVDGKSFIVIRIAESNLTPHIVGERVRIYVRTGEISNPINEADWEKLEWLKRLKLRRKNSIELRKSLIEQSDDFFEQALNNKHDIIGLMGQIGHPCVLSLKILPLPQNSLVGFTELMDVDRFIQLTGGNAIDDFPKVRGRFEPIKNGVQNLKYQSIPSEPISSLSLNNGGYQNDKFIYVLLNNLGLYVYKEKLGNIDDDENHIFDFFSMVQHVCLFLKSSTKFFTNLGYWGSLFMIVDLENLSDYCIQDPSFNSASSITQIPTDDLEWERKFTMKELESTRMDIEVELISDISWSLGLNNFHDDQVREFLSNSLYATY